MGPAIDVHLLVQFPSQPGAVFGRVFQHAGMTDVAALMTLAYDAARKARSVGVEASSALAGVGLHEITHEAAAMLAYGTALVVEVQAPFPLDATLRAPDLASYLMARGDAANPANSASLGSMMSGFADASPFERPPS